MSVIVSHVTAAYGRRVVLEDLSFTVPEGTVTALVGRNGAGKSTLAACLTGEKRDYRGTILVNRRDVRQMGRRERARTLACLPQILPRPHVTVRELAAFGRTPHMSFGGVLAREDWAAAEEAMALAGVEPLADAYVDDLSGGERKKAFFAMTLAQETPVVVLDEPTAHLDTVSRFAFMDLVTRLRRETGRTFLVVMHELPEVLRCADRIVAIHGGRLAFQGTGRECLDNCVPQTCFGVEVSGDQERGFAVRPLREE